MWCCSTTDFCTVLKHCSAGTLSTWPQAAAGGRAQTAGHEERANGGWGWGMEGERKRERERKNKQTNRERDRERAGADARVERATSVLLNLATRRDVTQDAA